jgi:hypothetical protein
MRRAEMIDHGHGPTDLLTALVFIATLAAFVVLVVAN